MHSLLLGARAEVLLAKLFLGFFMVLVLRGFVMEVDVAIHVVVVVFS